MPLSDQNCAELRNKYSEVQIIITDEIPMVPGWLLYQFHQLVIEKFSPLQDIKKVSTSLWGLISITSSSSEASVHF